MQKAKYSLYLPKILIERAKEIAREEKRSLSYIISDRLERILLQEQDSGKKKRKKSTLFLVG